MTHLLITGGAGFIGSHTCITLLEDGHHITVLDNFSNSSYLALERVMELTGKRINVCFGDIRNIDTLKELFMENSKKSQPFDAVIHFAGLKAVGESVADPLLYWDVNVAGSRNLFEVMEAHACRVLVFSSTSTVYGDHHPVPLVEDMKTYPIHPYGHSKLAVEQMLLALASSQSWSVAILRYFNPIGAHPSGRIGEDPRGIPNNLFPFITQVASGNLESLNIFGDDYDTPDGTGIRDYLHVMDLAEAHKVALDYLFNENKPQALTLNIGTGEGLSVFDVIKAFESVTGIHIPYNVVSRREGDVDRLQACPAKAKRLLNWRTTRSIEDMCRDGWAWQKDNPHGFKKQ